MTRAIEVTAYATADEDAVRTAVRVLRRWQVTDQQAAELLGVPLPTFKAWKASRVDEEIGRHGKLRLLEIIEIDRLLNRFFSKRSRIKSWLRARNAAFDGRSALDVMLDGGIHRVRRHLEIEAES